MLAGPVARPAVGVEDERPHPRRLLHASRRPRRASHVSRPSTAAPATGLRAGGSRSTPRSRARPRRAGRGRAPTSRSSRSRGAGRAAAQGRRAPGRAARRRSRTRPTPCRRVTSSSGRFVVYPPSQNASTKAASCSTASSSVSTETPSPDGVELRPLRDAVDVLRDLLARERAELVPRPADRLALRPDRERPLGERRVRRRACGEHGEVVGQVLAGRHAVGRPFVSPSAESPRDDAHGAILPRWRHYGVVDRAMRSSASTTSWSGTRVSTSAVAPRRRSGSTSARSLRIRSRSASLLPKSFVVATGDALEDDVGRSAEQDDRVEALVERPLVGDAAGDEERAVSVPVQELGDPVLAPERLGLALDPPAVVRVHDPVPTALELGEG